MVEVARCAWGSTPHRAGSLGGVGEGEARDWRRCYAEEMSEALQSRVSVYQHLPEGAGRRIEIWGRRKVERSLMGQYIGKGERRVVEEEEAPIGC